MKSKIYFITGIGTDIGKTVISAILVEKLNAEYWKPIQAGNLNNSDSIFIKNQTNCKTIHSERFQLTQPMSPHAAAKIDNIKIQLSDFEIPLTTNPLIIEGAGGLMVPINENELVLDLIKYLDIKVIIISKNYLGSINHSLLTIEVLQKNNIKIKGLIFNGDSNPETEHIIQKLSDIPIIGKVPNLNNISKEIIQNEAHNINL
jgi:dethiobiotin synthetase